MARSGGREDVTEERPSPSSDHDQRGEGVTLPGGLTSAQVRRIVADIDAGSDVVGPTIAEFIPGRSCTCSSS
jgi:hypothetical protein